MLRAEDLPGPLLKLKLSDLPGISSGMENASAPQVFYLSMTFGTSPQNMPARFGAMSKVNVCGRSFMAIKLNALHRHGVCLVIAVCFQASLKT